MLKKIDTLNLDFTAIFEYCSNNTAEQYNDVYEEVIGYDADIRTDWEKKIQSFYSPEVTGFDVWRPDCVSYIGDDFFTKHNLNKNKSWGRIMRTAPGSFAPPHIDVCPGAPRDIAEKNKLTREEIMEENNKALRMWIPLQDADIGHIFYGKDWAINNWKKGEVYIWDRKEIHGLVNAGITDRYVMTVTGYYND